MPKRQRKHRDKESKKPKVEEEAEVSTSNELLSGPSLSVYKNVKAGIELKELPNHYNRQDSTIKIKIVDLQRLVLWVLANGENPSWIFVKNKPLIPKVVVVFASGLGYDVYNTHKQLMPHITSFANFSVLTSAPGDRKALFPPLNVFYGCLKPKSQRKHQAPAPKKDYAPPTISLEDLILSKEDLADNNFPLPDRLVVPELVNPHTSEDHFQKFTLATQATTDSATSTTSSTSTTPTTSNTAPTHSTTTTNSTTSTASATPITSTTSTASITSTTTTSTSTESPDLLIPKSRSVCVPSHGEWARAPPKGDVEKPRLVALDCEMCFTIEGLELTRISVINECMETIYDSFVVPYNKILNYNTQYSGITEETLQGVTVRLEDVQRDLRAIIDDQTILAGHSLENDLIALKFVHTRVIDTSVLYPSTRGGRTLKNALRWLCKKYLQRTIQTDTHNSVEDSIAVMELVKFKLQNPNMGDTQGECDNLFDVLHAHSRRAMLIDHPGVIRDHASLIVDRVPVNSDDLCVQHATQAVKRTDNNAPKLIVAQLHELRNFLHASSPDEPNIPDEEKLSQILQKTDERVHQIYEALPENTLMVVATLQGDANYFFKLQKQATENPLSVTLEQLEKANYAARMGISFFVIK